MAYTFRLMRESMANFSYFITEVLFLCRFVCLVLIWKSWF